MQTSKHGAIADSIPVKVQEELFPNEWEGKMDQAFRRQSVVYRSQKDLRKYELPITGVDAEVLSSLLLTARSKLVDPMIAGLSLCESPVERAFLRKIIEVHRDFVDGLVINCNGRNFGDRENYAEMLYVTPQLRVGEMRIDFKVEHRRLHEHCDPIATSDELKTWDSRLVFVEIDGYTYHDRDAQRSISDKRRDRKLRYSDLDFQPIRFSSREIHSNPHGCVWELLNWLCGEAGRG